MAWSEEQLAEYAYQRGEGTWYDVSESQVYPWRTKLDASTVSRGQKRVASPLDCFRQKGMDRFPWRSQKNADVTTSHGSLPATGPVVLFPATGPVVLCCCLEEGAEPNLLIRS